MAKSTYGRHITLVSEAICGSPDELTSAQRAAMVTYNDEAACAASYRAAVEKAEADGYPEMVEYIDAKRPHAVLSIEIRGYSLRHNPNERGVYIQCADEDAARACEALGTWGWMMTRYGKKNTYARVLGWE